jgi:hypothetical protein
MIALCKAKMPISLASRQYLLVFYGPLLSGPHLSFCVSCSIEHVSFGTCSCTSLLCLMEQANQRKGSQHSGASSGHRRVVTLRIIQILHKMLTVSPAKAKPSNPEAQRILTFFMSSLSNRQLNRPSPLV